MTSNPPLPHHKTCIWILAAGMLIGTTAACSSHHLVREPITTPMAQPTSNERACALMLYGYIHLEHGDVSLAHQAFEQAALSDPHSPSIHVAIANTSRAMGDHLAAQQHMNIARQLGLLIPGDSP